MTDQIAIAIVFADRQRFLLLLFITAALYGRQTVVNAAPPTTTATE